MNNFITLRQCLATLDANRLRYGLLELQNGLTAVITEYGGRVLGPFAGPDGVSLLWINSALADPAALAEMVAGRAWNLGGDRIWIGPEIQYTVHDRADFWGSYALPPQMDPGNYTLTALVDGAWRLEQSVALRAHNLARGSKTLRLDRAIRPAADPLRHLAAYDTLIDGVRYGGYEHIVALTDPQPNTILSETWNLAQVNPGGRLFIPAAPGVEVTDYFAPVGDLLQRGPREISLTIDGRQQYKVGVQAAQLFGRMAYVQPLEDGTMLLIVRAFFCNPSAPYVEEPAHLVGRRGHAIHVYNDDGVLGGFGEMECQGQAIGGALGRPASVDQFVTWVYIGSQAKIDAILEQLVGVNG
jgi:hypothetical protein